MLLLPYRTERAPERHPWITWLVIVVNFGVFLWTVSLDPVARDILFFDRGFVPAEWKRWSNVLTCMFLHNGWLHVLGNMFFLAIFGPLVEDRLGRCGYAALYAVSGLLASATHLLTTPEFLWDVPCIGASGAVSGILGAAAVLHAGETVRVFYCWILTAHPLFGKVDVPALGFLGFWFLGQFLYAVSFSEISTSVEVAYWAHVGGFAFGALVGLILGLGRSLRTIGDSWARARRRKTVVGALRTGAWERAEGALKVLVEQDGLPAEWALLPARIAAEKGAREVVAAQASAAFHQAAASHDRPRLLEAYTLLVSVGGSPEMNAPALLVLVRALNAAGRQTEALAWLAQTLRREPGGPAAPGLLFEWAETLAESGDAARAAALFRLIAATFPNDKLARSADWRAREIAGTQRA